MALTIDPGLCPQNHACPLVKLCPAGAISQTGHGLPVIDTARCIECGKCQRHCGMQAVRKDTGHTTGM